MKKCPYCESNYINDNEERCLLCDKQLKVNNCNVRYEKLNNHELFIKTKKMFEINRRGFLYYLTLRGYRFGTKNNTRSTAFGYVNAIDKICSIENITFNELFLNIERYSDEYSLNGIKKELGNYGNGTRRNALNRLGEFKNYIEKFQS